MFYNRFAVNVISKNNKIKDILETVPQPEDSLFEINTLPSPPCGGESFYSVSIIDCTGGNCLPGTSPGGLTVLLASAGKLPCEEDINRADDLWVMPDGDIYSETLLKFYFTQLMKAMKGVADSRRMEICFTTAIDSIPDLVWFKDVSGAHLMVNNAFCKAVEKTKEQIYKQGHYYIWDIPQSEYEQGDYVCLESEKDVMDARKTLLFDEKVKTKSGMKQFRTYKSPLIEKDGTIFGTCGFAHDVTDIQNTNNELDTVLESMPYAVVVADKHNIALSVNSKFREFFPGADIIGKDFEGWKNKALADHTVNADGDSEICINANGETKTLVFADEPIFDIFREQIGTVNIFRDITLERNYEQQTLRSANTDFLTKLHNRRSLFSYLSSVKSEPQLSLIYIDLDNFKKVNDNFGHPTGDEALVETSRILEECFPDDFVARLGGDEFLTVICGRRTTAELEAAADNLLKSLCGFYKTREEFSVMTASVGISSSVITEGTHDIEKLLINGDSALYRAKNSGKAQYKTYSDNV